MIDYWTRRIGEETGLKVSTLRIPMGTKKKHYQLMFGNDRAETGSAVFTTAHTYKQFLASTLDLLSMTKGNQS